MTNTSIVISDELLEEFDDKLFEEKTAGNVNRDTSRSEMIRILMREWVNGNIELSEGNDDAVELAVAG